MKKRRSFKINILVIDGIPDGLRLVEKSNWNGLGIVCPRGRYPEAKKRKEFSGCGVYLLVGKDEGLLPDLYVGEADQIRSRLDFHNSDDKKEFWQKTFIFTTRGTPLNKAQVKYLEARLVELATAAGRSNLQNLQTPKLPKLSEADEAEMEGFLDELLTILPVLEIPYFEPRKAILANKIIYELKGTGYRAQGAEANEGFLVMKDSIARLSETQTMKKHFSNYCDLRKKLIQSGVLQRQEDGLAFTKDWLFNSPSAAAVVCSGKSAGPIEWKDKVGVTLKDNRKKSNA
ncbi:MAG: GIY-YIG nuclease family protein [Bacteroidetes bacterium]|nr:GIY-YIG nuclease family protein [Bacteroidota bacterium]